VVLSFWNLMHNPSDQIIGGTDTLKCCRLDQSFDHLGNCSIHDSQNTFKQGVGTHESPNSKSERHKLDNQEVSWHESTNAV
jgi:hypothetical protein